MTKRYWQSSLWLKGKVTVFIIIATIGWLLTRHFDVFDWDEGSVSDWQNQQEQKQGGAAENSWDSQGENWANVTKQEEIRKKRADMFRDAWGKVTLKDWKAAIESFPDNQNKALNNSLNFLYRRYIEANVGWLKHIAHTPEDSPNRRYVLTFDRHSEKFTNLRVTESYYEDYSKERQEEMVAQARERISRVDERVKERYKDLNERYKEDFGEEMPEEEIKNRIMENLLMTNSNMTGTDMPNVEDIDLEYVIEQWKEDIKNEYREQIKKWEQKQKELANEEISVSIEKVLKGETSLKDMLE